ncbi:MAG: ATPase F0F1 [Chlorobiaceae bacterium]|nr:ATPase F0F1 [Chlorobiales bacterium]NTU91888.1 ATPase F0F1 [Chlorobiaceae bacterium]NTV26267.1 ATPase F0F1 [Chlorobiaceae bacterium]
MNWTYATATAGGILLGFVFFGALLVTVRKGLSSQQPWLWFLISMIVRATLAIAGFLLIAGTDPIKFLCCAGGFTAARVVVVRLSRQNRGGRVPEKEAPCI